MTLIEDHSQIIAQELKKAFPGIRETITLLDEGATVPFIARYRKELTGGLDEVAITYIRDRLKQLKELEARRQSILASLQERDLLKEDFKKKILQAETLTELEDLYLPFRPKRRTRATLAREKGLDPLAKRLWGQKDRRNPLKEAQNFVDPQKNVKTAAEALAGARDIMAEWVSEHVDSRAALRKLFYAKGGWKTSVIPGKEEEGRTYQDFFDFKSPVRSTPSHRFLGLLRAEKEGMVTVQLMVPEDKAIEKLKKIFILARNPSADHVREAIRDGFRRLLYPSLETEIRLMAKKKADTEAIVHFAQNLHDLLMEPPLGAQRVLAIDPGLRTGSKAVALDEQGRLLHHTTLYQLDEKKRNQARQALKDLCQRFHTNVIAIGHGTGSREVEDFLNEANLPKTIPQLLVSETGASVYSASEVARAEFPDLDVTIRGAISIGRRLQDPLAELVKIDPKSIGVGQYQHDVDQRLLRQALDDVVMSCVNQVGVEVNSASSSLLSYVSGLNPTLASRIIRYREEHGPFRSREELKEIPGMGPRIFEQSAGFLRIRDGGHPLDTSAVHPERYGLVETMARDLNASVLELMQREDLRQRIPLDRYISSEVGVPTLQDILKELEKPGRDPRPPLRLFEHQKDIRTLEDLKPGMMVPGVISNITAFGAFVDIGVHQDGLIHVSELSDTYIKDPREIVSIHQKVRVKVLEVDHVRRRIALSLKGGLSCQ